MLLLYSSKAFSLGEYYAVWRNSEQGDVDSAHGLELFWLSLFAQYYLARSTTSLHRSGRDIRHHALGSGIVREGFPAGSRRPHLATTRSEVPTTTRTSSRTQTVSGSRSPTRVVRLEMQSIR